ncbi:GNAT family N-acetyltransferase [Minwuia thermotolerans]|nr:GNAT family N-acetyltransferase [Minwuia thermotolerans]
MLTELALRSKAHWGYDAAFMDACRDELTVTPDQIVERTMLVAEEGGRLVAMAGLEPDADVLGLWNMFVTPECIGTGLGGVLFRAIADKAREAGARCLYIDSDPNARPFYEHMGARLVSESPSDSIPGRTLPRLRLDL